MGFKEEKQRLSIPSELKSFLFYDFNGFYVLMGKNRIVEPLGLKTNRLNPNLVRSNRFYGNYPDILRPKRPFEDIARLYLTHPTPLMWDS
jgi:hypothetical protein